MVLNTNMMMMEGDVCGYWQPQVTRVGYDLSSRSVLDDVDEKPVTGSPPSIEFWATVDNPVADNSYEERRLSEKISFEDQEMAAAKVLLDLGRVHTRSESKEEESSEEEISPLQHSLCHSVPSLPTLLKDSPPHSVYYNPVPIVSQPLFLSTPDVHAFATANAKINKDVYRPYDNPVKRYCDETYLPAHHYRLPDLRAHSCHNIFAQTDPLRASVFVNKISLDKDYYMPKFSIGTQTEEIDPQPLDLSMSHMARLARKPRSHSLSLEPSLRLSPYSRPHKTHINGVAPPCSELVRCKIENQILRKELKSLKEKLRNTVK